MTRYLIDRDKLIISLKYENLTLHDRYAVRECIDHAPVIQEQKSGKWINASLYNSNNLYACSECGNIMYSKNEIDILAKQRFCSKCGSRNTKDEKARDEE